MPIFNNKTFATIGCLLLVSFTQAQFITGFRKPATNPILGPDSSYKFFCPVQQ
jgi:hypothetical protein